MLLTFGTANRTQLSALICDSGYDMTTVTHGLVERYYEGESVVPGNTSFISYDFRTRGVQWIPASVDCTVHFGLVMETSNPPTCILRYESTRRTTGNIARKNPKFNINYEGFSFNAATDYLTA